MQIKQKINVGKGRTWGVHAMTKQKNTLSEIEMGLDHHHKGISLHLSATTKKPTRHQQQ